MNRVSTRLSRHSHFFSFEVSLILLMVLEKHAPCIQPRKQYCSFCQDVIRAQVKVLTFSKLSCFYMPIFVNGRVHSIVISEEASLTSINFRLKFGSLMHPLCHDWPQDSLDLHIPIHANLQLAIMNRTLPSQRDCGWKRMQDLHLHLMNRQVCRLCHTQYEAN